jgi:hypothetical protein
MDLNAICLGNHYSEDKMVKKIIFLVAGAFSLGTATFAADSSRLRLMIPVSATNNAEVASTFTEESYDASGYNLNYVTGSGWGIGYTSTTIDLTLKIVGSSTTITSTSTQSFLDLSYTIGSEWTAQFVLGYQIGQTDGDIEYSTGATDTVKIDSYHGSAWAINGGYDFGGAELLVGYRSEFTAADVTYQTSGTESDEWIKSNLVTAGFGLTF